jgi:hypothetical protein
MFNICSEQYADYICSVCILLYASELIRSKLFFVFKLLFSSSYELLLTLYSTSKYVCPLILASMCPQAVPQADEDRLLMHEALSCLIEYVSSGGTAGG